jgi:hypothetical protein
MTSSFTYELLKVIGSGTSAQVWLAHIIDDPSALFAVKLIETDYLALENGQRSIQ